MYQGSQKGKANKSEVLASTWNKVSATPDEVACYECSDGNKHRSIVKTYQTVIKLLLEKSRPGMFCS